MREIYIKNDKNNSLTVNNSLFAILSQVEKHTDKLLIHNLRFHVETFCDTRTRISQIDGRVR